jgi:hypothetical protein
MSIVTYTLYIPAKVLGFMRYGLMGLAVVTSVYLFVNLIIQILLLEGFVIPKRKKVSRLGEKESQVSGPSSQNEP